MKLLFDGATCLKHCPNWKRVAAYVNHIVSELNGWRANPLKSNEQQIEKLSHLQKNDPLFRLGIVVSSHVQVWRQGV